jgi:hypothetical protein
MKMRMTIAEAMAMDEQKARLLWLERQHEDPAYRNALLAALFERDPSLFEPANGLPC